MIDARSASLKEAMAKRGRPDACFCEDIYGMTLYAKVPTEDAPEERTRVILDWDRDLEMLRFGQQRAEMSPDEARSVAAKLRHAAESTANGALIRESVFLEQAGFGELSVVTGGGEEFNLCFGDGDFCFARFSVITELTAAHGKLLAKELESAVEAIEELLLAGVA